MPALASRIDEFDKLMCDRGLFVRGADEFEMRSQSINKEERSFEAIAATETPAMMRDYRTWDIIDEILVAKGGQFPAQIPLLDSHMRFELADQLGSARSFNRKNEQWIGRGFVGRAVAGNAKREQVWQDIEDGHIRSVSIGYQVLNYVDIPAGKRSKIDGKTYQAGDRVLRISTEWRAHELSVVSIGADSLALIRSHLGNHAPQKRSYFL